MSFRTVHDIFYLEMWVMTIYPKPERVLYM